MIKPLNNHCLIEVIDEYEGVVRNSDQENVQKGKLIEANLGPNHLTTSTGYEIKYYKNETDSVMHLIGKVVYWQEFADAGSKFTIDGKKYVLIPFYRLVGFDNDKEEK